MNDINDIAKNLIDYSLELKEGNILVLENFDPNANGLVKEIINYCNSKNINVALLNHDISQYVEKVEKMSIEELNKWAQNDLNLLKESDGYLKTSKWITNFSLFNNISEEKRNLYEKIYYKTVHEKYRVNDMKWCLTEIPEENEISKANFDINSLKKYYYDLCSIDYNIMADKSKRLVDILKQAKEVLIKGLNTDISFSINGMGAIPCVGKRNFPDGEVYTAPIKNSVNGYISYNIPSFRNGYLFEDVYFEVKDGKIVKAESKNNSDILNKILDIDEGARYFGEFSFGINPLAINPIGQNLIDEKLSGSFHLTPGCSYKKCSNGNESLLHYDLVCSQLENNNGGQIYLDGKLFRDNGYFVDEELKDLNPKQYLKK